MESEPRPSNFLRDIVAADVAAGRHGGRVVTRFPPEPNGYPHLGHAQSICLNFGLAAEFGGVTNLRYDDTNPEGESLEFAEALGDAVRWLGFEPAEVRFASDYFEPLYAWAVGLVERRLAYVDSQTDEAIRAGRGTVTEPGTPSPYRDRPAAESLRLLDEMRRGEHPDGSHVLRARIDTEHGPMAHPNMKLRDPIMYRIRRNADHYRRGDDWHVYPLYDWAHGQGDAIEGVTHSVCTLEFDVNRPLYDWYLDAIGIAEPPPPSTGAASRPHQYEFARFNLDYTVTSKRKLRALVEGGAVAGWDDPRLPTIAGQRRRGVRPQAIRSFFDRLGVTKVNGSVQYPQYEYAVRDDLNGTARRVLAVTDPVPLTIENLPEPVTVEAPYWPHDVTPPPAAPLTRPLRLGRDLYVERDDVSLDPPKGWRRLAPGAEVRLRHGYVIKCVGVETDDAGGVASVTATADLDTLDAEPEGRRVPGVIHWANAADARPARFRLYNRLFTVPQPGEGFLDELNPDSFVETEGWVEPSVADDAPGTRYQFERLGYFWQDPEDSAPDGAGSGSGLVFNRIVALRDSWGKKAEPAPPRPEKAAVPARDVGPRDPASALTDDERERYDALVGRGVGEEEAAVLAADADLLALFEETVAAHDAPREAGAVLVHDLRRALGEAPVATARATGVSLAAVLRMVEAGTLTRNAAAEAVAALAAEGGAAEDVVAARGLAAIHDAEALGPAVDAALDENPEEVARYRAGEARLFGFFVGQAMRRAGKGANPQKVQTLLRERLA